MSQWTHILGVIRYDSWNTNIYPKPIDSDLNIKKEVDQIKKSYNNGKPNGSDGPVGIKVVITSRGPTVLITGDLRDFGKENLEEVVDWLNESYKSVVEKEIYIELRDSFITCDVEELGSFIIRNTNTKYFNEKYLTSFEPMKFELNNPTEYQGY